MERPALICKGELLLGLRYFRNSEIDGSSLMFGELLLDLRYFRNCPLTALCSHGVSYCLIYGTSKTHAPRKAERIGVSYCLDYGTSETR